MDLLILGNGTAGLAAALTAVQSGLNVTLICKATAVVPPESHPLQSIHPGLASLLESIGASRALRYSARAAYTGILRNGIYSPLSNEPGDDWKGYHISKPAFEFYLAYLARQKGVFQIYTTEVRNITEDDQAVTVTLASGEILTAQYLIDASGQARVAGKLLKIEELFYSPPLIASTAVINGIPADAPVLQFTRFDVDDSGWTWIAPESTERLTWTRLFKKGNFELNVPSTLKNTGTEQSAILSKNVRWRSFSQVRSDRILLVGEAAALLDPGTGQGMLQACLTAAAAVKTILTITRGQKDIGTAFTEYNAWFLDQFHSKRELLLKHYQEAGLNFS